MSASILILDDEIKMGKALRHVLRKEGHDVDVADDPRKGIEMIEANAYHVLLCDLKMPGMSGLDVLERCRSVAPDLSVIIMTAYASAETAVESMKRGAYDYLIKPFSTEEMKILVARCLKEKALEQENTALREQVQHGARSDKVVAVSRPMLQVLERARKVAPSEATVLITGESGVGKELLAQAIHEQSPRSRRPVVAVNCGALTESLLESELFGHRRGAFTGAVEDRMGIFEAADGGTIFLDEIGEISQAMQVKLLRVLQSGQFQRVGDSGMRQVNVRVLAATNRDLEEMVRSGLFRTDLYYRLNVVPIRIPPLRERPEDILPLIAHILSRHGAEGEYRFSPEAVDCLESYDWPGNVRELENAVEHAVVLAESSTLGADALPAAVRQAAGGADFGRSPGVAHAALRDMTLEQAETSMIQAAMEKAGNNMTRAAQSLGITRRTLGYRLRKYGLYERYRGAADTEDDGEQSFESIESAEEERT